MRKLNQIKQTLEGQKEYLKEKYEVKEIGVFGSYLRGEQKKKSDLDILIDFMPDSKMDLLTFIKLENYLSDLLGIKVDLVMKTALKPRIGKRILEEVVYL
jgi:hypothetical protein